MHERVRWPDDQPGGWHLPSDTTEAYCRQIGSEGRVKKPSGGYTWIQRSRDNHFLDCEAMAYAAAYMLGVQRIADTAQPRQPKPKSRPQTETVLQVKPVTSVTALLRSTCAKVEVNLAKGPVKLKAQTQYQRCNMRMCMRCRDHVDFGTHQMSIISLTSAIASYLRRRSSTVSR